MSRVLSATAAYGSLMPAGPDSESVSDRPLRLQLVMPGANVFSQFSGQDYTSESEEESEEESVDSEDDSLLLIFLRG